MVVQSRKKSLETILLVEDNPLLTSLYLTILSKLKNCTVLHAREETEVLSAVSEKKPKLVLLDLMIPSNAEKSDVDVHQPIGINVLKKIRSNEATKSIKVAILSNLDADEHRLRAEELGADAYIVKAMVPPEELLRRVSALLVEA